MTDDLMIGHRAVMASVKLGVWMSAALNDPDVCEDMKADIREWFSAGDECSRLTDRIEALTAENERLRAAFLCSIAWVFDIQVDFKLVPREDEE